MISLIISILGIFILGILVGLGWGYGWGSQSTYKFYAPRLMSKDNVLWKDFNRNVKTIEKLRKRLAGKYITDQRNATFGDQPK